MSIFVATSPYDVINTCLVTSVHIWSRENALLGHGTLLFCLTLLSLRVLCLDFLYIVLYEQCPYHTPEWQNAKEYTCPLRNIAECDFQKVWLPDRQIDRHTHTHWLTDGGHNCIYSGVALYDPRLYLQGQGHSAHIPKIRVCISHMQNLTKPLSKSVNFFYSWQYFT